MAYSSRPPSRTDTDSQPPLSSRVTSASMSSLSASATSSASVAGPLLRVLRTRRC
ncbi:Uncharacterised protein [Mycobacteroides abscessus subsp. abscessus]|nr:Uncharacterised protein [Mycobacteroides abscessus subsp. abscessus]